MSDEHGSRFDLIFLDNTRVNVITFDNSVVPSDLYHPVLITEYVLIGCGDQNRSTPLNCN